ncbi:hypothetical protein MVES_003000 [Malassezia vespertilionis]|uniref:Dipeptidyl-peptidase V n=1 Tax=Malassezia vespertilionis TaxID=2020962 RepID=A0A2N1J949_9BASI|nr:hypothetical protein MVES_003000 [Malassezia vespertilionis]
MGAACHTLAPYGEWASPITSDLVLATSASIVEIGAGAKDVFFTTASAKEDGRTSLTRLQGHEAEDFVPHTIGSVRSLIHNYGGGAFSVRPDGSPVFAYENAAGCGVGAVDPADKRVEILVHPNTTHRYGDFGAHPSLAALTLAIEEEHGARVQNRLVCLDTRTSPHAKVHILHAAHDFYAYPRFSPDASMVAYVTWEHSSMPFWATQLWVAQVTEADGLLSLIDLVQVAGSNANDAYIVAQQPVWVPGTHTLLYTESSRACAAVCEATIDAGRVTQRDSSRSPGDVQPPLWELNISSLVPIAKKHMLHAESIEGMERLVLTDRTSRSRTVLSTHYTQFAQLRIAHDAQQKPFLVAIASAPRTSPELISIALDPLPSADHINVLVRTGALDPALDAYISVPESITFPTTLPEGQEASAHAFLYPPTNPVYQAPAASLPPCRIYVHGGPTSSALPTLDLYVQYWTSRGWCVCAVNYGGSTGYGYAYMSRLHGQWGIVDSQDCIAAAEHLSGKRSPRVHLNVDNFSLTETCNEGVHRMTLSRTGGTRFLGAGAGMAAFFLVYGVLRSAAVPHNLLAAVCAALLCSFVCVQCRVHTESVTVFPNIGVQLDTVRGFSRVQSTFISRNTILDFFMLESIQRWGIVDYAVLATNVPPKRQSLHIVYPNLMPPAPLYIETYRCIYPALFGAQEKKAPLRVDPSSICISGRSSGGYTVLHSLSTFPDTFCAGYSAYGICDLLRLAQHTHKFESHYLTGLLGGTPDTIPHIYHERSPIFQAHNIKTPVLLFQGTQDKVVPPEQGRAIAAKIREHGGVVEYVELPNEGHGFRTLQNQKRALEAEYAFFQARIQQRAVP